MEEDFYRGQLSPLFQSGSHKINPPGKEKESLANMKTTTPHVSNSTSHSSRDCRPVAGLLIPLVLICFALLPRAQGVLPAPDGGYPGGNTAEGTNALFNRTSGVFNTAIGLNALLKDTTGSRNTANGANALRFNTTGFSNTAVGTNTLFLNSASNNTAIGADALFNNTVGTNNVAVGFQALFSNIGFGNTAIGVQALVSNTGGFQNTATGNNALFSNTIGNQNTAIGDAALIENAAGTGNIALGFNAGTNLTSGSSNIYIGNPGVATESTTIRIGSQVQTDTFIAGISGTAVAGTAVVVNASGKLGVIVSSSRFKAEIKPMDKASEAILALKPVTFHYKNDIEPTRTAQFGLVAEEVADVNPDLVVRDADGEIYTVRYDAVNAMLLNEFLKEHRTVQQQEATIAELKATVAQQQKGMEAIAARLQEQESQIQKVSAQLEVKKPAPRTVLNDQ